MNKYLVASLALCAVAHPALAKSMYVTDQVKITLRTGESTEHKVIEMLESGLKLEVLSQNEETGYSYVRTSDGDTGYVLTRLLMETPSARQRLDIAEKRLTELQQEPEKLASRLATLQTDFEEMQAMRDKAETHNRSLTQELDEIRTVAADAVNIAEERNMLRKRVAALNGEVGELKLENQDLRNQT